MKKKKDLLSYIFIIIGAVMGSFSTVSTIDEILR